MREAERQREKRVEGFELFLVGGGRREKERKRFGLCLWRKMKEKLVGRHRNILRWNVSRSKGVGEGNLLYILRFNQAGYVRITMWREIMVYPRKIFRPNN